MSIIQPISFGSPELHPKKWSPPGEGELWIINNEHYCAKILPFKVGESFSSHYHWEKVETWYVVSGTLLMKFYDLSNADEKQRVLYKGDVIHVPAGNPHQLTAIEDSVIYETSTPHRDEDSYRIKKGSSQINLNKS